MAGKPDRDISLDQGNVADEWNVPTAPSGSRSSPGPGLMV